MSYVTQADLVERYGEDELLAVADPSASGTIDSTRVERAIADATGEVEGYLASRYTLPLDPVPSVIASVAADIARYRLHDDGAPETVRQRYEDAVRLLRGVARGDVRLGAPTQRAEGVGMPDYHAGSKALTRDLDDY